MKKSGMEKRMQLGILFAVLLLLAVVADCCGKSDQDVTYEVPEYGSDPVEEEVILNAGDVIKDYTYPLTIEEQTLTEEEAEKRIQQVKDLIDQEFSSDGEDWNHITQNVNPSETYTDQGVKAEWIFDRYDVVHPDGELDFTQVTEDGVVVNAQVDLSCGNYQETYAFSFVVYPRKQSEQEELLTLIEAQIKTEQETPGNETLTLPEEVNGIPVSWKRKTESIAGKILVMELLVGVLLFFREKEKRMQERKQREQSLALEYPEIVGKLVVLLESGMSIKQAWNRISAKYLDDRQKNQVPRREAYEEMVCTQREIQDGELELVAFQKFGERTGISCYRRLVRILLQSMKKGSHGIQALLEQEVEAAYQERKNIARRLGEEAGTKMLLPMMGLLVVVMAIVIMPAIANFGG